MQMLNYLVATHFKIRMKKVFCGTAMYICPSVCLSVILYYWFCHSVFIDTCLWWDAPVCPSLSPTRKYYLRWSKNLFSMPFIVHCCTICHITYWRLNHVTEPRPLPPKFYSRIYTISKFKINGITKHSTCSLFKIFFSTFHSEDVISLSFLSDYVVFSTFLPEHVMFFVIPFCFFFQFL